MESNPENVRFYFGDDVVGHFEDQPPSFAGQYRYMPFRGWGHFRLLQELARRGPQYCHYVAGGETRYFTVDRITMWVLEVSDVGKPPVSRILEST